MIKPVLLTVDDDPGVSRAVARDTRRRYGEHYRVVRADSALDAVNALREIKRRGAAGQAAVFFSCHARQVTLLVWGESLERSMSHYLITSTATPCAPWPSCKSGS